MLVIIGALIVIYVISKYLEYALKRNPEPTLDSTQPMLDGSMPTLPTLDDNLPTMDKTQPTLDDNLPTNDKTLPALDDNLPTLDEAGKSSEVVQHPESNEYDFIPWQLLKTKPKKPELVKSNTTHYTTPTLPSKKQRENANKTQKIKQAKEQEQKAVQQRLREYRKYQQSSLPAKVKQFL
jgi:hypothetical protein